MVQYSPNVLSVFSHSFLTLLIWAFFGPIDFSRAVFSEFHVINSWVIRLTNYMADYSYLPTLWLRLFEGLKSGYPNQSFVRYYFRYIALWFGYSLSMNQNSNYTARTSKAIPLIPSGYIQSLTWVHPWSLDVTAPLCSLILYLISNIAVEISRNTSKMMQPW